MRWIVQDRFGHEIYMTEERWQHALDHDWMSEELLETVLNTIKQGRRYQEALDPNKYRYYQAFDNLPGANNHVVVVVKFGFRLSEENEIVSNNFVLTAYLVEEL
jgi:hypothetical protein